MQLCKKIAFFFLSLIISSIINSSLAQQVLSRPDSSSKQTGFLWFTGYWKSKNVFITKSYTDSTEGGMVYHLGGGSAITISPDDNVHLSSQQVDDWNKKIDDGLKNLQQFQDKLNTPSEQISEWGHHFTEVTEPQLEDLKTEYTKYKVDKNNDLTNPGDKEPQKKTALQNFISNLNKWCNETRPKYDAIISFYEMHKKDKESDYINPIPPEFDYTCIACDTNLQKQHDKQSDDYVEKFFKPESDLMRDALGIDRNLMLLGVGSDFTGSSANVSMDQSMAESIYEVFSKKHNGACSYIDNSELNNAIRFLALRMYWRAKKLFKDYRNNIKTAPTVIRTLLAGTRNVLLMGFQADEGNDLAECAGLVAKALDYYSNKLFHEHDWSGLANIPFLLSLERQEQLLGGTESDLMQKLIRLLNGFHLEIEMDVKLGKDNGYAIAHLKGEEKIAPEFNYDNDTCYRWVVTEGTDKMGFPKKKSNQQIECDLLTNEIVAPGPRPVYIGTKKYFSTLYNLKMDYCHPGRDTILLSGFIPNPNAFAGKWQVPGAPPVPLQINGTDNIFRDVNKMKELAESGKAQQGAEKMKAEGEKIAVQMKALQQQMGNGRGAPNLANMQKIQDLAAKAMSIGTNENVAPILYIDFPLEIKNNTATLQDKRYDAKQINPMEASVIIYGYYTVKVEFKNN